MIMMMLVVPSSIELLKKQPLEGKTVSCTNTSEIILKAIHVFKVNSSNGKENVKLIKERKTHQVERKT